MATNFEVWNGNPMGWRNSVNTIAKVERLLELGSANDDFAIWLVDVGGYLSLNGDWFCDWNSFDVHLTPSIRTKEQWRAWLDSPYGRQTALRDRMWAENAERQASLIRGRDRPNGAGV